MTLQPGKSYGRRFTHDIPPDLPPWFQQYRDETDDRFQALHGAVRSLHDRVLGKRGDEPEPEEESSKPAELDNDDLADRHDRRRTHDRPKDLAGLNSYLRRFYQRPWSARRNAR